MASDKLEPYKKKRIFERTSEPKPANEKPSAQNRFVIHYHDASHLHYDLRLELNGVLKSWAVPKGLPTRQGSKKLAVAVEDHPIEYIAFEGTIPSGQYGAGIVKVYDTGTYLQAHQEESIEAQLNKGRFSFFLIGQKIQLKLTLVQIKKSKNWLLLLLENDSINPWVKDTGQSSTMLSGVQSEKAYLVDKPFDSDDYIYELKYDGLRAISYISEDKISILSRNQHEQLFRYPELGDLGDFVLGSEAVLDGEIVAYDENGLPSFETLQQRMNLQSAREIDYFSEKVPVVYYIFDVLYWQGRNLLSEPLMTRKKILSSIIIPYRHVQLSEYIENDGIVFFAAIKEKQLEGIIAKKKDSPYEQRRTKNWLKVKAVQQQEVVIGGFTEPRGARKHFGALLLGVYKGSDFVYAGHTGAGFSDDALRNLYDALTTIEIGKSPFVSEPKPNEKVHWVKPLLVAEIKFTEWTSAGRIRQPVFLGLRQDIDPKEVRKEAE